MLHRPRIGITTSLTAAGPTAGLADSASGLAPAREQRLDLAYVRAVEAAGGLPLVVPVLADADAADAFAALLDGLVVTGGPAVTEGLVGPGGAPGALPDDLVPTDPDRTATDRRLLAAFLDAGRPALGICYGMQLASAIRGGTIWADAARDRPATLGHSVRRGAPAHAVTVHAQTHLRRILGTDALTVPTRHVQAVAAPGAGLVVSAVAPDGVVEALETADGAFVGVQWHPEALGSPHDALFADLVVRAAAARDEALGRPARLLRGRPA